MGLLNIITSHRKSIKKDGSAVSPKKILVVEDDKDLRDFYCKYLQSEGFEVLSAYNGQSGLEMVVSWKPDIVILDLMMPVMDGKTMLRKIRDMPEFKKTPVILLTNIGDADFIKQAQYFNADDLLIKSNITPDELLKRINLLITRN